MSTSISFEKLSFEDNEFGEPPYKSFVSSMRRRNPNLVKLEEILARQVPSPEDGRAAVIEIHDFHIAEHRIHTSGELLSYLNGQDPASGCSRRVYLLEGLPANYVDILGRRLQIDPDIFNRQIKCGYMLVGEDVRDVPLLSSHPTSKESSTVRYPELRDFGKSIHSYQITCTNQRRRVSTTQIHGKFEEVGILRRKASFWARMDGEKGWNALILLDAPVGEDFFVGSGQTRKRQTMSNTPYRGGYIDFSPQVKSTSGFDTAAGPGRTSALDDLCYYWARSGMSSDFDFSSPASATIFLKRYIASHWMALLQYTTDLRHKQEYTIHRAPKITDISASRLEQCWGGVQYQNFRVAGWCEQLESSIQQFTVTGTLGDFPGQERNNIAEDDFIRLYREFQREKKTIGTDLSSIVGLLSIYETKRMKELSHLGMLFVPLAFTSGIFSMSGSYAPGGASFWVYWAVAAPLVILMFVAVFGMNSGPALAKSWTLKARILSDSFARGASRKSLNNSV